MNRFLITFFGLLFSGCLMMGCQKPPKDTPAGTDSLILQTAHAQSDTLQRLETSQGILTSRRNAITLAVSRVSPAVVGITVKQIQRYVQRSPFSNDPFWRQFYPELFRDRVFEREVKNQGSGFLISRDGYILSNDHVVGEGDVIMVTLPGGERHQAQLVGTDRVSDISLLKIDGGNFPYIQPGNSTDLIVGEWAIALGNPFGLFELSNQPTVTVGVISAIHRDWGRISETGRIYLDMIQTDAAINHGNSGGPLVNSLGQVIGMNTFIYTGSQYEQGFVGLGFAIPINRIQKIIEEIKSQGSVNRDYWLGFMVQDLSPVIIRALGLQVKQGVIVTQIDPGSSADRSGFRTEDVIIQVNNLPVYHSNHLINILENMDLKVGSNLTFTIIRNHREEKIILKLIERK